MLNDESENHLTKQRNIGVFKFGKIINISESKSNETILQSYLDKKVNSSPLKSVQNDDDDDNLKKLNSLPLKGNNNNDDDVNVNLIEISDLINKPINEDITKKIDVPPTNIGFLVEDEKSEVNIEMNDSSSSNTMLNLPNIELNNSNKIMFNIFKDNSTSTSTSATAISSPFTYLNNDEDNSDMNSDKVIIEEKGEEKEGKEEKENNDNDSDKEEEMEESGVKPITINSEIVDQQEKEEILDEINNNESNELVDDPNRSSDVEESNVIMNNTTDINKYVYIYVEIK